MATKRKLLGIPDDELRLYLAQLAAIDNELKARVRIEDPVAYGLPDLLRPKEKFESDEDFVRRQNAELKELVETRLWIEKDGVRIDIIVIPEMLRFLADLFYGRVSRAILWKGRGAGGSLAAAILIWLKMVYQKMSFIDLAGSAEQAKVVYAYTKQFWYNIPGLSEKLLQKEPLQSETRLVNGVILRTVAASEKQARGKHFSGCIADESCQATEGVDQLIQAALQGAMSEKTHCIVLLSTFHYPIGLFADTWDFAEERGFSRYAWDCFDTLEKCLAGMEFATPEDPSALKFCYEKCELTERHEDFDDSGKKIGERHIGCAGRARHGCGWQSRKNLLVAKRMNRGTKVFETEYMNCFAPGALVLTENGFEKIEDIREGTLVLTHRGRWRKAHPMSRGYRGRAINVSGQGGISFVVTPSHPIFHLYGQKTGWVSAEHFLSKRWATYLPAVSTREEKSEIRVSCPVGGRSRTIGAISLPHARPDFFRFLGLFLGDGYCEFREGKPKYPGMSEVGKRNIRDWTGLVSDLFGRNARVRGKYEFLSVFGHVGLGRWLVERTGRYCYEKRIPPELFISMGEEDDRQFLRGLLATDGRENDDQIGFRVTSPFLAGQVYIILIRNGIPAFMQVVSRRRNKFPNGRRHDCRELFDATVSGPARDQLLRFVGRDVPVRKGYSHIRRTGDWIMYPRKRAEEVEYDGWVYNLSVDDDESYCLPGMAVHNCRPEWMRPVYDSAWIERSLVDKFEGDLRAAEKVVGIDWGLEGQTCVLLMANLGDAVGIVEAEFMSGKLTDAVISLLRGWEGVYGKFVAVYPDQSHPYNNLELGQAGFNVLPVNFLKWKEYGIGNVIKHFSNKRIRILKNLSAFIDQMKRYRRDRLGKPIKREDHGPDALMCAMLHFKFEERFGEDFCAVEDVVSVPQEEKKTFEGMSVAATVTKEEIEESGKSCLPLKFVGEQADKKGADPTKEQVLVF